MLYEPLAFLIKNLVGFFLLNLLLRFYLQVARAPFGNPLAQFTVKLTNFIVLPARRLIPSVGTYDTATLLLAWLGALLMHVLLLMISPWPINLLSPAAGIGLSMLAVLELFRLTLYLLFGAVLVHAIMSWVNPYNPLAPLLDALTRPFLAPLRRMIPLIGGIDLSPLVLILFLQMLLNFAVSPLEMQLMAYIVQAA